MPTFTLYMPDSQTASATAIIASPGFLQSGTGAVTRTMQDKARETVTIKDFGVVGDDVTDDTAAAQLALNWLAAGARRQLIWNAANVLISSTLTLPNLSEWVLEFAQVTRITQATDNTPIFMMQPSASRYGWCIIGSPCWFQWSNNQAAANTKAIGIAFKPTTALADGIYGWEIGTIYNENGYDLISLHPDTVTAGTIITFWGFRIDKLYHQTMATGRVFALNSGGGGGLPAGVINAVYIKATNAAGNVFFAKAHTGLRINSMEVNDAYKRTVYFESCIAPSIGSLRFEIAELTGGEDLMSVAGSTTAMTIENLELQSVDTTGAVASVYGITAYGGAIINIPGGLSVRGCEGVSGGQFYVFRPQSDGSSYGKILLPPAVSMQKDDDYVQLHTYTEAIYVSSSSFAVLGPYHKAAIAGVSAFTPMATFYDGTNTFTQIVAPVDGYITALHISLSAAVTAGSVRFYIYKNGSGVNGYLATISSGTTGSVYAPLAWAPQSIDAGHKVARGDTLQIMIEPLTATGGGNAIATLTLSQLPD